MEVIKEKCFCCFFFFFFPPNLTPCLLDSTHYPRSGIFTQAQSPSLCYQRILKQHTLTWASVCNSVGRIFPSPRPDRWCNPRTNAPGLCQSHSVLFLHGTRNVRPHLHQSQPSTTSVSKWQETQHGYKAASNLHSLIMHYLFLFFVSKSLLQNCTTCPLQFFLKQQITIY